MHKDPAYNNQDLLYDCQDSLYDNQDYFLKIPKDYHNLIEKNLCLRDFWRNNFVRIH